MLLLLVGILLPAKGKWQQLLLQQQGARILIVDTSGADNFQLTRQFYENLNYTKEAVIRDFWEEGDDKVVFWKKLN